VTADTILYECGSFSFFDYYLNFTLSPFASVITERAERQV